MSENRGKLPNQVYVFGIRETNHVVVSLVIVYYYLTLRVAGKNKIRHNTEYSRFFLNLFWRMSEQLLTLIN